MRSALLALACVLGLAACGKPVTAPTDTGVCWFMVADEAGTQHFKPFVTGIENLESCAARLEVAHVRSGLPVNGAFQGRFIFVTAADVTEGRKLKGQHYRVFTPAQREKIRENLPALKAQARSGL